jgi:low temperature requirement protein LtrA
MLNEVTRDELLEAPVEREQRVTPLELFFDLVFVFGLTQTTRFLYREPSWLGLLEALAILMVIWLSWSSYLWLGNTAGLDGTDEGATRFVLFIAMGAVLVASLAVPNAFGKNALLFGIAFFVIRALHVIGYTVLTRGDPAFRAAVIRHARTELPAAAMLVLAGLLPGTGRGICWVVALAIDYVGPRIAGLEGWRINPGHFAERYGLIVIIALGESIIALGVAANSIGVGTGVTAGALLAFAVAAALWWAYFDTAATVAERKLRDADPTERVRIARDSYTYPHLPMIAGIVIFAFGVQTTLLHLSAHLHAVPAVALCGGVSLYLLAVNTFKQGNIRTFNNRRVVAAAALAALAPAATVLPALLSLGLVALITAALTAYEVYRYAETRGRIRHGLA